MMSLRTRANKIRTSTSWLSRSNDMPRNGIPADGQDSLICACGRTFSFTGALSKHRGTCQTSKKRLSGALDKAKQLWAGSKRRRRQTDSQDVSHFSALGVMPSSSQCLSQSEAPQEVREFSVFRGSQFPNNMLLGSGRECHTSQHRSGR